MSRTGRTPMADAVERAYRTGLDDERMEPLVLEDENGVPRGRLSAGDSVVFYDIRGEREVELTRSLTDPEFKEFPVKKRLSLDFVTMVQYDPALRVPAAFPPERAVKDTLCDAVSRHCPRFGRVAESEKAIHMTFFLDGKQSRTYKNEDRRIVQSLRSSGEKRPLMMAKGVADSAISLLSDPDVGFTAVNFANVDVVGHFENRDAILKAVREVDRQLGRAGEHSCP